MKALPTLGSDARTIADHLAATNNRPAGFDYLRIILALLVVISHVGNLSFGMTAPRADWAGPLRPLLAAIVPMFFALSGFLVAGSMVRCRSLAGFLGLRILRLMPALMVDTAVSALIIGPMFTALPLTAYLTHPMFHAYWGNVIGDVHYFLPGLFETHPSRFVNEQLWTLPWEFVCYASLAGLWVIGAVRTRWVTLAAAMGVGLYAATSWIRQGLLPDPFDPPGLIVACFLFGVAFYQFRDAIRLHNALLVLSLGASALLLADPYAGLFAFVPLTYATVHLGMLNPPRNRLIASGDYSYGIYLYAFPLQQAVVAIAGPGLGWRSLVLALPLICVFAAFSWWCVEKPAMTRLRPMLHTAESWLIAQRPNLLDAIKNRREIA